MGETSVTLTDVEVEFLGDILKDIGNLMDLRPGEREILDKIKRKLKKQE